MLQNNQEVKHLATQLVGRTKYWAADGPSTALGVRGLGIYMKYRLSMSFHVEFTGPEVSTRLGQLLVVTKC